MSTILLADSEQFILVAYKSGLEQAGYRVVTAEDGEQALQLASQVQPDLILLELILPKLNGFEVLRAIKIDPTLSIIPVMVLSSLAQPSDEAEARSEGAVDFIAKADVTLNDLLVRIERILA